MTDTCHYVFVKTHIRYNSNVNYRLYLIIMYQYGFISYNKYTTLKMLTVGETVGRDQEYGNSVLSAQFPINLKLSALKIMYINKN